VLLEYGEKLQDNDLTAAVKGGHLNVVNVLIEAGADPNTGDPLPMVCAISMERKDVFHTLLEHGATLDGENGAQAVKKAREEGLTSMLTLLGEHGVDITE
jgi:ankyrin repeat protein